MSNILEFKSLFEDKRVPSELSWQAHFVQLGDQGGACFQSALILAIDHLKAFLETMEQPYSGVEPDALNQQLRHFCRDDRLLSLSDAITEVTENIVHNSIIVQHPNCIAHLHTPPLLPSVIAELFISTLNQSMDSWDQSSAATFIEQHMVDWLCERYRLGFSADGVFTSGGTQSNLMGLLLARDWAIDCFSQHSVQQYGLPDYAHKLRIICSDKSHFTVKKSAALMGLGEQSVVTIETTRHGTINLKKLQQTLIELKKEGLLPFVIVGTAGTTDHGAIDDLSALADIAQAQRLWLHVDAAYGGALIFSQSKARLKGIERADSVTIDFHKLFYQSISCGALLIKDKSHFQYLCHHADYLNREDDPLPNLVDKSIVTTKRFDALKLLMTLKTVGTGTLGAMYDHLLAQTLVVAECVEQSSSLALLAEPQLSTVLFRCLDPQGKHDALNKQLRLTALKEGIAVIGETYIDGQVSLKLTLLNPCLTLDELNTLLQTIEALAERLIQTRK